jgi:hypothetical protein
MLTPSGQRYALSAPLTRLSNLEFEPSPPDSANKKREPLAPFFYLARPERFELPTNWFEASYSIQLSYERVRDEIIAAWPSLVTTRFHQTLPISKTFENREKYHLGVDLTN